MAGQIEEIVIIGERINSSLGGFGFPPSFFFGGIGGHEVANRIAFGGGGGAAPPPQEEGEPLSEEEAGKLTQLLDALGALIEDLGEDAKIRVNGEVFDVGVLGRGLGKFATALEAGALISDIIEGDFEIGAAAGFVAGLAVGAGLVSAGPIAAFAIAGVASILVKEGVNFVVDQFTQKFNEFQENFERQIQELERPGGIDGLLRGLIGDDFQDLPPEFATISSADPSLLLLGPLGETRIAMFSDSEKAAFGTMATGLSLEATTSAAFTFVNGVDTAFGTSNFVGIRGSVGNDTLTNGHSESVLLDGASGNDHLISGSAHDTLVGGSGQDILEGSGGHDTLYGASGADTLLAGAGDDILFVDGADLSGGAVDGGAGIDALIVSDSSGLSVTASDHNVELIFGGEGNDTLRADTMVGAALRGGAGDDVLIGNSGSSGSSFGDELFGGSGNDVLLGGAGSSGSSFGDELFGGAGNDVLNSGSVGAALDIDTLEGGLGNDRIEIAGLLDDRIFDEGGNDRLVLPIFNNHFQTFEEFGDNLAIVSPTGQTQLLVFDWFVSSANQIETIEFADGSTISAATASSLAQQADPGECPNGDLFCELSFGFPVVFDLDGDGLELTSMAESGVRFDMDGDGYRERTGWVGPDDGILTLDVNGNGQVDGIDEISFTRFVEGARTDLEGLSAFDETGDGVLDASDGAYGDFRIWRDNNGNGRSDRGELRSLTDLGIESLALSGAPDARLIGGNAVLGRTTFTRTDGATGEAGDVALKFDALSAPERALERLRFGLQQDVQAFAGFEDRLGGGLLDPVGPTLAGVLEAEDRRLAAAMSRAGGVGARFGRLLGVGRRRSAAATAPASLASPEAADMTDTQLLRLTQAMASFDAAPMATGELLRRDAMGDMTARLAPSLMAGERFAERQTA